MAVIIQAARQFAYVVARLMAKGEGTLEASMVKAYVCKAAEWVTREAMQIHGGMGYAEEYPVSRYFVDARVLSIFEGADETLCLKVIARRLVEQAGTMQRTRGSPAVELRTVRGGAGGRSGWRRRRPRRARGAGPRRTRRGALPVPAAPATRTTTPQLHITNGSCDGVPPGQAHPPGSDLPAGFDCRESFKLSDYTAVPGDADYDPLVANNPQELFGVAGRAPTGRGR